MCDLMLRHIMNCQRAWEIECHNLQRSMFHHTTLSSSIGSETGTWWMDPLDCPILSSDLRDLLHDITLLSSHYTLRWLQVIKSPGYKQTGHQRSQENHWYPNDRLPWLVRTVDRWVQRTGIGIGQSSQGHRSTKGEYITRASMTT